MRLVVGALVLAGCAAARPSRWQTDMPSTVPSYTVCECDGSERAPTPSEAASFRFGERVDFFCDGKVHDCRPGRLHVPVPRGYTSPLGPEFPD